MTKNLGRSRKFENERKLEKSDFLGNIHFYFLFWFFFEFLFYFFLIFCKPTNSIKQLKCFFTQSTVHPLYKMSMTSNTQHQSVPVSIASSIQDVYRAGNCIPPIRVNVSTSTLGGGHVDTSIVVADDNVIPNEPYGPQYNRPVPLYPPIAGGITINNQVIQVSSDYIVIPNLELSDMSFNQHGSYFRFRFYLAGTVIFSKKFRITNNCNPEDN
jgi:hypothetical protein